MCLSVQHCEVRNQTHTSMEKSTAERLVEKISVVSASKPISTVIVLDIYGRAHKITVSYLI